MSHVSRASSRASGPRVYPLRVSAVLLAVGLSARVSSGGSLLLVAAAAPAEKTQGTASAAPPSVPASTMDASSEIAYRIDPLRSSAKFEMPATLHTVIGRTQSVSGQFTR